MKILITGVCGFIAHHLAEELSLDSNNIITGIDSLTYASRGTKRLVDAGLNIQFFHRDINHELDLDPDFDYIFHLAAETHVDNSVLNPCLFVKTNVLGTANLLSFARKCKNLKRFLYFSTDEVFGSAPEGVSYKEYDRYNCGNPYSASKAGGEELCVAFANTYKLPVIITHCMNAFGERQHPEKFLPLVINKVLKGEKILVHSNPERTKAGSRFYIHARNIAKAVSFLMDKPCGKYNICGEQEVDNEQMVLRVAKMIGIPAIYELVDFHSSRPSHDLRYSLDGSKMKSMGWSIPKTFDSSLEKTVKWYLSNRGWLEW